MISKQELIEITSNILDIPSSNIELSQSLRSLGMDSIQIVSLFKEVEKHAHVTIPEDMIFSLVTLESIMDFVKKSGH